MDKIIPKTKIPISRPVCSVRYQTYSMKLATSGKCQDGAHQDSEQAGVGKKNDTIY